MDIGALEQIDLTTKLPEKTDLRQSLQLKKFQKKSDKILYYKQIAKKPGEKNIGGKLLSAMFDEGRSRGYRSVICKIVHQPIRNETSVAFHEKFGFKKISSLTENNITFGIYFREI